ncbi:hypothetical protein Q9251_18950 [Alkalihalobacillus macyae]|uniref:hypothetical protein n=1 Tax=Guptibacillus hwajinpoensis TaxID=208199 RepID=UPI00273B51FB|nr:hypothetical protein [Alkalihalobacillus macyae]MDP4552962.1 hypothetical protein [Alkalihalobacillus macyae]
MVKSEDLIMMKNSYGFLFLIENILREKIKNRLENDYGQNWNSIIKKRYGNNLLKKPFENMYFYELISLLRVIPELKDSFEKSIISNSIKLNLIRNKIAHCKVIDEKEYVFLYHYFEVIKRNV